MIDDNYGAVGAKLVPKFHVIPDASLAALNNVDIKISTYAAKTSFFCS
jgi:hypothetical protein